MKNRISSVLAIALLSFSLSASAGDPPLREKYAVDWFAESCINNAGKNERIADWALSRGLPPLTDEATHAFLLGSAGQGWAATYDSGEYVIVMRADGLCTLFARRAEPQSTRTYFFEILNHLLPESRYSRSEYTEKKKLNKGILETTHFNIGKEGSEKVLHVVISTSDSTEGNYQVAMSTMFCEKAPNKALQPTGCAGG
jgi:hypothetical protein